MVKITLYIIKFEGKYYRIIREAGTKSLLEDGEIIYSINKELTNLEEIDDEIRQEMRKRGIKHVVHLDDRH